MKQRHRGARFGQAWYDVDLEQYRRHLLKVARLVDQRHDTRLTIDLDEDGRIIYGLVPSVPDH